jgi:hypothetical protein
MMPCCEGTNPKPGVIVCQKKLYHNHVNNSRKMFLFPCPFISHVQSHTNAYSQSPRTLALTKLTLEGEEEDGGQ